MRPAAILLVPAIVLVVSSWEVRAESNGTMWKGFSVSCTNEERNETTNASVSCHGIRLVRKIVQKLLEDTKRKRSLEIMDGVSLVEREDEATSSRSGRVLKDYGAMGSVIKFLENRELRIKLPSFLPSNLESAIERSLPSSQGRGHGGGGGLGGGKKGDGGLMLMALMMGKMMAAMGFGALGLLAMKALMVSSLALMLSLIVAAKKLAGGKEEDSHHVVYAQEVGSHHRRRRDLLGDDGRENHPYRGYMMGVMGAQKL